MKFKAINRENKRDELLFESKQYEIDEYEWRCYKQVVNDIQESIVNAHLEEIIDRDQLQ